MKFASSLRNCAPSTKIRDTKGGASPALLTPFEEKMAAMQMAKESSVQAKGRNDLPRNTKSCHVRDVHAPDLLKSNLLGG
ncbi:unnamed protein product [Prunus armeniaca]